MLSDWERQAALLRARRRERAVAEYEAAVHRLERDRGLAPCQLVEPQLAYPTSLIRSGWKPSGASSSSRCWQGRYGDGSTFLLLHGSLIRDGAWGAGPETQFLDTVRIDLPEAAGLPHVVIAPRGNVGAWSQGFYGGLEVDHRLWPDGMRKLRVGNRTFHRRYDVACGRSPDDAQLQQLFDTELTGWLAGDPELGLLGDATATTFFELIDGTLDSFWVRIGRQCPPHELGGLIDQAEVFASRIRRMCRG